MKLRPGTKGLIGLIVLLVGGTVGYNLWSSYAVSRITFQPIEPGSVNLVAVNPGAGYRIIVANQIAQLAEIAGGEFERPEDIEQAETVNRKRIPLREMLQALQGNEKALGHLIMVLNDMREEDLPPEQIVWKAEDLRRAIDGDAALRQRLERDLNSRLDGTPLDVLSVTALMSGIVIDSPVPVRVQVGNEVRTLVGRVREPFRTRLMQRLEKKLEERGNLTNEVMAGEYRSAVEELLTKPDDRENVAAALEETISPQRLARLAEAPERVLGQTTVILTERQIVRVDDLKETPGAEGRRLYTLTLHLNDEGRNRLWKYSHGKTGFQILWIVDGIAIGAPVIRHELRQHEVSITQLPDAGLARSAVEQIRKLTQTGGTRS